LGIAGTISRNHVQLVFGSRTAAHLLCVFDTGLGSRQNGWRRSVLKRCVDIVLSVSLLIVAVPILAAAAIAIEFDSEGPVFFVQARMGRGFRRFALFKLRTMRVNCEGTAITLGVDPRITRVGHWLRWSKVDELPQLWNVLRGEMSMVGPRPVIPELAFEFVKSYLRLLEVRPGLTDPASMKYCREEELLALFPDPLRHFKTVITPDKLRISAAYLDHSTVRSDLRVLIGTALALFPSNRLQHFIRVHSFQHSEAANMAFAEPIQRAEAQQVIEEM
jgi:lipopolysaccharide/colanic/teichoic acid biosynthesis glycosyltransferase